MDLILLLRAMEKESTVKGDNRASRAAPLQSGPRPSKQNRSRKCSQVHSRVWVIKQQHNEAGLTGQN